MANLAMEGAVFHQPVMLAEVVDLLAVDPGRVYVDATVGEGGHAQGILEASGPLGRVLGIDLDPRSLTRAVERLSGYGSRFIPAQGNYAGLERLASAHGITQVHGVLLDLGFSSLQIEAAGYGFSFQRDEPLDMRYDPEAFLTILDMDGRVMAKIKPRGTAGGHAVWADSRGDLYIGHNKEGQRLLKLVSRG